MNSAALAVLLAAGSVCIALFSVIYAVAKDRNSPVDKLKNEMSTLLERVSPVIQRLDALQQADQRLGERLVVVETKVDTFWSQISVNLATILHRPEDGYGERDRLIDEFQGGHMTRQRAQELSSILQVVVDDHDEERAERAISVLFMAALAQMFGLDGTSS